MLNVIAMHEIDSRAELLSATSDLTAIVMSRGGGNSPSKMTEVLVVPFRG